MSNLLMSKNNPNGWKLEELLKVIQIELNGKTQMISHDTCEVSKVIQENNNKIVGLLEHCIMIQNESMRQLDTLGENQGATGKPRIGG